MKTEADFSPRHILCPVDLSEHATLALKYAAAGARAFGATLTVLQAIEVELPPYFTPAQMPQLARQTRLTRAATRKALSAYVRATLGPAARDLAPRPSVVEGHPTDAMRRVNVGNRAWRTQPVWLACRGTSRWCRGNRRVPHRDTAAVIGRGVNRLASSASAALFSPPVGG
jgi:hypothetical protein